MILILHAYSRQNRGDGLLVDLTIKMLEPLLASGEDCCVVALDADSFNEAGHALHYPLSFLSGRVGGTLRRISSVGRDLPALREAARNARLLVGVGGGYLRTAHRMESLKTALAHWPQLRYAARSPIPSIYLPQSIGPLNGTIGRGLRRDIRNIDRIYVRDDRSLAEIHDARGVIRAPDLAVLEVGEATIEPNPPLQGIVCVARRTRGGTAYDDRIKELARLLPEAQWAIQSEGRGNDDRSYYEDVGLPRDAPTLEEVLSEQRPSVVVSVRLHGSLGALLAGAATINLSYERKGFGAFDDLNLSEYVHPYRRFDPVQVAAQARSLRSDTSDYWGRVQMASKALQSARDSIREDASKLGRS